MTAASYRTVHDGSDESGRDPTWKPDGTQVAFEVNGDIFVANDSATPNETQMTFAGDAEDPSWSRTPGDDRIAYTRHDFFASLVSASVAPPAPTIARLPPRGRRRGLARCRLSWVRRTR